MNKEIDNIRKTRIFLLNAINDLSVEQLNKTPEGFNNNIIWNLGHLVAAQQGVCYLRAGVPMTVDEKYWTNYKPGSKPVQFIDAEEVQEMKDLLLTTIEQLANDYKANVFGNYVTWTTRYGAELSSIDDVINFLPYHDGLHSGVIMAMLKIVRNNIS